MYQFGWGDSVCVRQALLEKDGPFFIAGIKKLLEMGYPSAKGLPCLIKETQKLAKKHFDSHFRYVIITAGAHHGMATILRAFKDEFEAAEIGSKYFSFYPRLLKKEKYIIEKRPIASKTISKKPVIRIVDSPSNPQGLINTHAAFWSNVLWDGVYNNSIYSKLPKINPGLGARFFIGSFSKFFGLNGIRLGWIGCNSKKDAEKIEKEIVEDTLGISLPSQYLAYEILKDIDLDNFQSRAAQKIDINRELFSKLERYFNGSSVPKNGMFYLARLDSASEKLLKSVKVEYIDGKSCGAPGFARFNLAQSNELTSRMVNEVLKKDNI